MSKLFLKRVSDKVFGKKIILFDSYVQANPRSVDREVPYFKYVANLMKKDM